MFRISAIGAASLLLAACSTLDPAIHSTSALNGDASHIQTSGATLRNAYIFRATNSADGAPVSGYVICAEPQPDAATQLAAKGSLSGSGGRVGQNASADAVLEYNSSIVQLAGRSSTVLLARDFLFNVCLLRANGFLTDQQVFELYHETISLVRDIATADKIQAAADAVRVGAPPHTVASILGYTSERELKVTESALALVRMEAEADRRAIVTPIFACAAGDNTCVQQRDALIADRDLTSLTSRIGSLSASRIEALHAALSRRT